MLVELIKSTLTPCPKWAKKMGFVAESVAIDARAKRCAAAWEPHQKECKKFILQAVEGCEQTRTALVAGSGACLDLPLKELADRFDRVILLDIVHPITNRSSKLPNVLQIVADITGVGEELYAFKTLPDPVPVPDLYHIFPDIDLVVSLNLLSQLPVTFLDWLQEEGLAEDEALDQFGHDLIRAHLDWLQGFQGVRCLITDRRWEEKDPTGRVISQSDPLYGIEMPGPDRIWRWAVAPMGELDGPVWRENLVAGYLDYTENASD
ncbi:hypothetical protein [Aestuariispira insulae]|uniref:Uncharacterized protein n=1 Tax=Aestuariispira insulae TaxID=1461337 RepID=A0A3D9H6G2_9PROT|nr:hypothetical protein [Aestuariispira insulae]RED45074.1 hypothetical protein DFP90_11267 [Aestuariispira insulae]